MQRVDSARFRGRNCRRWSGYTLIEIIVAVGLSAMLLLAVVRIFGAIGDSMSNSRASLELSDSLRSAATILQNDLAGVTVTVSPPRHPKQNEGYLEIKEGPMGVDRSTVWAVDPDSPLPDTTVGDLDDWFMATIRSKDRPFVGRAPGRILKSHLAEVAWFVRGNKLHRRVLLVAPQVTDDLPYPAGFYGDYDLSVHWNGSKLVPNTLGDLTKRECRFAHRSVSTDQFPFDARVWGHLGLPTLRECSATNWEACKTGIQGTVNGQEIDYWSNQPYPNSSGVDPATGVFDSHFGNRIAEDVILDNVISFDIKVWDPGAPVISDGDIALTPGDPEYAQAANNTDYKVVGYGAYVDMGYGANLDPDQVPAPQFNLLGRPMITGLAADPLQRFGCIYDTGSSHYEHDGINQDIANESVTVTDQGSDGFDNNRQFGVDDPTERETSTPYPVPLRGIQIKIRVFEPDSRQIREVTIKQDFLTK